MSPRTVLPLLLAAAVSSAMCAAGEEPRFDGGRAFSLLEEQCRLGPRTPGSPAHVALEKLIEERLAAAGAEVTRQSFEGVLSTGENVPLVNVTGRFAPKEKRRLLIGAHYDTRPRADLDPDPASRGTPIPGANDGASGVAVLLELARILGESKPPIGVDLVFFDGEDLGQEGRAVDFSLGSKHYAALLGPDRPVAVIVVDMVGKRGARFLPEGFSEAAAPGVCSSIWTIAEELGAGSFERGRGPVVIDDHLPFIQAGLPAVDIIDFDYPQWHTLADTPDKCDAASLDAVGRVLVRFIWRER